VTVQFYSIKSNGQLSTCRQDEINTNPSVSISPIPGKESLQLHIHLRQASPSFEVKIHDFSGKYIETLYSGSVELGEQRYTLDTKQLFFGQILCRIIE
jgi:hypothetical protein